MRLLLPAVVVVLAAGCGGASSSGSRPPPASSPSSVVVAGTVTLQALTGADGSGGCEGMGGYSDISAGAQVSVENDQGTTVGLGHLGPGVREPGLGGCQFTFAVPNLPTAPFYKIEVSHRGALTFSLDDVEHNRVQMTLGQG